MNTTDCVREFATWGYCRRCLTSTLYILKLMPSLWWVFLSCWLKTECGSGDCACVRFDDRQLFCCEKENGRVVKMRATYLDKYVVLEIGEDEFFCARFSLWAEFWKCSLYTQYLNVIPFRVQNDRETDGPLSSGLGGRANLSWLLLATNFCRRRQKTKSTQEKNWELQLFHIIVTLLACTKSAILPTYCELIKQRQEIEIVIMPVYNFKKMHPVPAAPELIDIVLMRTQRKTPTVIHPGYKITRIRAF